LIRRPVIFSFENDNLAPEYDLYIAVILFITATSPGISGDDAMAFDLIVSQYDTNKNMSNQKLWSAYVSTDFF
jgi:hypothetical protein